MGLSDPFCVCEVPDKPQLRFETAFVSNDLNPVWNHTVDLIDFSSIDSLSFSVWDKDLQGKSDLLGKVSLMPDRFVPAGFDGDLELEDRAHEKAPATLKVKIEVIRSSSESVEEIERRIQNQMREGRGGGDLASKE